MRTKTLLLAAALTAAGIASTMAQSNVYSLNVVGYYNVTVSGSGAPTSLFRYKMIANQLQTTDGTLNGVLGTNLPPGTTFLPFNPAAQSYATPAELIDAETGWDPNYSMPVGSGGFIRNLRPAGNPDVTVTFVGEVKQGSLTNVIWPSGYSIQGSSVPQAGLLKDDLKFSANENGGDFVLTFIPGTGYATPKEYLNSVDGWDPSQPNLAVGEAFFVRRLGAGGTNWVRNFTVP
jgi:hypothetical protein